MCASCDTLFYQEIDEEEAEEEEAKPSELRCKGKAWCGKKNTLRPNGLTIIFPDKSQMLQKKFTACQLVLVITCFECIY